MRLEDEDIWVHELIAQHGSARVRGGSYSQLSQDAVDARLNLPPAERARIEQRGASDTCFACGSPDHWVAECPEQAVDELGAGLMRLGLGTQAVDELGAGLMRLGLSSQAASPAAPAAAQQQSPPRQPSALAAAQQSPPRQSSAPVPFFKKFK
jgi:hypothetical protein